MKRNSFGINFDEGIPLLNEPDFELLYVEGNGDGCDKLKNWIKKRDCSATIGGQIGSGKTTLISKVFFDVKIFPDITFDFDREGINQTTGDFLRIVVSEIIDYSFNNSIVLPDNGLAKYLLDADADEWSKLHSVLKPEQNTLISIIEKKKISEKINEGSYVELVKDMIGFIFEEKPDIFMFLSGIDKFHTSTPAYLDLKSILKMFADHSVLFEVNAIHLFNNDEWIRNSQKINIFTMTNLEITDLLEKRLGEYKDSKGNILNFFADWSGGNPRQALRLLTYFESWFKHFKGDTAKALESSLKNTISDYFSYSEKPEEKLLNIVAKNNYILGSMVSLPMDRDSAKMAVYNNWILLDGNPDEDKFPAKINPLVKYLLPVKLNAEEPEMKALQKYAEISGISSFGLDFKVDSDEFKQKLKSILETPVKLNITEILDVISVALLSKNRADRVIIAYENEKNREVALQYLFAKSNSYEYQQLEEIAIDTEIIEKLKGGLSDPNKIYSFVFPENCEETEIRKLDSIRDCLINYQMIWWVPYKNLKTYLSKWTQLRQLFQVFVLEEELSKTLKIEDIKDDLEFMEDLVENENTAEFNYVKNLKEVLEYLKEARNE